MRSLSATRLDTLVIRPYNTATRNVSGPPGDRLVHSEISNPMAKQLPKTVVTMKDIAREVGLSITTVSRALNDHDDVALETRTLVHEVARRLDYHPNAMARSLQNNRADAIGLLIPPILHRAY